MPMPTTCARTLLVPKSTPMEKAGAEAAEAEDESGEERGFMRPIVAQNA
jgi:hypothetical protein